MRKNLLRQTIYENLLSLASEEGIYASGKEEIYGCIFGRDSAITILKILKTCSNKSRVFNLNNNELLSICRRTLLTLTELQGKDVNPDSGEEPGKFIHEFRKNNFEHLVNRDLPWYIYPDGFLRNYDSIDSTPLNLIAIYRYFTLTKDWEFLLKILPSVEEGLSWILNYSDKDGDFLVEYEIPKERKFGGLIVHSWTDSHESIQRLDGTMPSYPIAPVEVQGYIWLALKLWSRFFANYESKPDRKAFALKLSDHARNLKRSFNKSFIYKENGLYYAAQVLDGDKNRIDTVTGNPLLLLWATYKKEGKTYSIIEKKYIADMVSRAFKKDLFDKDAGIRTMSVNSPTYNPKQDSYHNGSFWPKLNGMIHEGLYTWKYYHEANMLKRATLKPIKFFGTPIELYIKSEEGLYQEFKNLSGQESCRIQAWSAAAILDLLTIKHNKRALPNKIAFEVKEE